jgi:hypothetical protein
MKLRGIMPLASLAVSTPATVPAGALAATVKLLIVIVMTSPVSNETIRARRYLRGTHVRSMSMICSLSRK